MRAQACCWQVPATRTMRRIPTTRGIVRSIDGGATWTLAQQSNDGVYGFHSFVGLGVAGFA